MQVLGLDFLLGMYWKVHGFMWCKLPVLAGGDFVSAEVTGKPKYCEKNDCERPAIRLAGMPPRRPSHPTFSSL